MWKLVTASRKAPRDPAPGGVITYEAYREAADKGLEVIAKKVFEAPSVGMSLVREKKVKQSSGKVMHLPGMGGYVPVNRDEDSIPTLTLGIGFIAEWQTYPHRAKIEVSRAALEQDEIGFLKDRQRGLMEAFMRTVEAIIADHFNRGFGTDGAPRLAADGCYYIDENRYNPDPRGGVWSNLEATADLTEDTLFTASYNAANQVSPTGDLFPTEIKKIMVPKAWELKLWKVLNTDRVLGSNNNDANWASGVFSMKDVIVNPYLTTDCIYYWLCDPKSEDNDLVLLKLSDPTVMTGWGSVGDNPDIMVSRIRAEWGLAILGDGRRSIRGGLLQSGGT